MNIHLHVQALARIYEYCYSPMLHQSVAITCSVSTSSPSIPTAIRQIWLKYGYIDKVIHHSQVLLIICCRSSRHAQRCVPPQMHCLYTACTRGCINTTSCASSSSISSKLILEKLHDVKVVYCIERLSVRIDRLTRNASYMYI